MSQVYLYDATLKPLAELQCRTRRSWVLNQPDEQLGAATVWLSVSDPNLSDSLLRFGNLLVIHDPLLGDWAGPLGEPQELDQAEVVLNATAAEILLDDRTALGARISGSSGAMFRQIVRLANLPAGLGIAQGDIEPGDGVHNQALGTRSLLKIIQALQERSGCEWGVAPGACPGTGVGDAKIPILSAWWKKRAGQDLSASAALIEGTHLQFGDGPVITLHGQIKNEVSVVGMAATQEASFGATRRDPASISAYGLRQMGFTENISSQAGADARAAAELAARSQPLRRFDVTVDNPDVYPYLRIGNTLTLELHSIGFQNGRRGGTYSVRVIGMSYDDEEGVVPLILEEVTSP